MAHLNRCEAGFAYYSFGMQVNSALELPGLPPGFFSQAPDVVIRFGRLPEHLPKALVRGENFEVSANDCLLIVPDVGRYRISAGRSIIIDPAPAGSLDEIRMVIYSAALGVLFHQRELLPLHASAIEVSGRCVAFTGPSHAGKSTLASYLQEQGYRVVADDVCPLAQPPGQEVLAYPGLSGIRLWKDALARMGKPYGQYQRVSETMEKYQVPTAAAAIKTALPCAAIVQIGTPVAGQAEPFQRLHGLDAVEVIFGETFWGNFIDRMGKTGGHFRAAVGIANRVPIYRCNLRRSWGRMHAFQRFIREQFNDAR